LCEEATAAADLSRNEEGLFDNHALVLSLCGGVEAKKHESRCNKPEYMGEKMQTENRNPPIAQGEEVT
jgi:hypothetical protein